MSLRIDSPLPNFRDWTRTADGGATCAGYRVIRIADRAFVAYAPDGSQVDNTGDWTSKDRPFANVLEAIGRCRIHAASL